MLSGGEYFSSLRGNRKPQAGCAPGRTGACPPQVPILYARPLSNARRGRLPLSSPDSLFRHDVVRPACASRDHSGPLPAVIFQHKIEPAPIGTTAMQEVRKGRQLVICVWSENRAFSANPPLALPCCQAIPSDVNPDRLRSRTGTGWGYAAATDAFRGEENNLYWWCAIRDYPNRHVSDRERLYVDRGAVDANFFLLFVKEPASANADGNLGKLDVCSIVQAHPISIAKRTDLQRDTSRRSAIAKFSGADCVVDLMRSQIFTPTGLP